eukprot:g5813.t1
MAAVFSFICTSAKKGWTAKCCNNDDISEVSADDRWSLEKQLKQEAISHSSGGGISSTFSWVTPKTAICQFIIGGGLVAVAAGGGGGSAPAAVEQAPAKEEEKEESEESGSEMGFSLFD